MDDEIKLLAKRLGAEVKRLRLEREMTQEDLADEARITANYVSLVELGQTNVTIAKAKMIAAALGLRLTDVLARVER